MMVAFECSVLLSKKLKFYRQIRTACERKIVRANAERLLCSR